MKYTVVSGKFKQVMNTKTPSQAAIDAIGLWTNKKIKPTLAKITTVTSQENKEICLLTTSLLDQL